jgi:precorrin-4/cobalt-precorrin-4 C11-methyltransferase
MKPKMKLYFVGAGPGDPDLITVKGKRLLAEADLVIYAGSLVNPALVEGLKAETMDSNSNEHCGLKSVSSTWKA